MKNFFLIAILFFTLSCTKQVKGDMKILEYTGQVKVNTDDVRRINTIMNNGDTIITDDNSTCDIIIKEKNIFRLKQGSKLTVKISGKECVLRLDKGCLTGVLRKVFSRGDKFLIETPAVSGATGNATFCIKIENEKCTYICTCNGSMELKGKTGSGSETIEAVHHTPRNFKIDKNGALIEDNTPGLLYHSDSEIEQLAEIIRDKTEQGKPATQ